MVVGESRYFKLSPVGGGSLDGYTARIEVERVGDNIKIIDTPLQIVNNSVDVKIQTDGFLEGSYMVKVFIEAPDGFVQGYTDLFELK